MDEGGQSVIVGGGKARFFRTGNRILRGRPISRAGCRRCMMRHLATIAFEAGFKELITEVLPDNAAMLKVFEKSGFPSVCSASRGSCCCHSAMLEHNPLASGHQLSFRGAPKARARNDADGSISEERAQSGHLSESSSNAAVSALLSGDSSSASSTFFAASL